MHIHFVVNGVVKAQVIQLTAVSLVGTPRRTARTGALTRAFHHRNRTRWSVAAQRSPTRRSSRSSRRALGTACLLSSVFRVHLVAVSDSLSCSFYCGDGSNSRAVTVRVERERKPLLSRPRWQQRARESVAELRGRRVSCGAGAARGHHHNAAHALEGQPAFRAKRRCAH